MSGLAPLFVALAEVELHLLGARSLKDKRHELRSLIDGLRHRFTLLVVKRDHQDLHQRSALALAALATDAGAARGTLEYSSWRLGATARTPDLVYIRAPIACCGPAGIRDEL